ncbi:DUF2877 domain-containing protein [Paenibacillus alvei]|uniref:DUF2877 domain-containing protein n=1 Tax=Paenibacillus alvei TaxID=44250 RepID=UPI003D2ABC88
MRPDLDFCSAPLYTSCLRGEEIHAELPALLSQRRLGFVHSIFENGINLAIGESEELVFIGTTKNGRLPFGIHMGVERVRRLRCSVRCGDPVIASTPDMLLFRHPSRPLVLDLSQAEPFQYHIEQEHYRSYRNLIHIDMMLHACRAWGVSTGLGVEWSRFLAEDYHPDEPQSITLRHMEQLMISLVCGEVQAIEEHLRFFLGRGQGLTPAGDDCLVGILAVQALTQAFHPALLSILHHIIEREEITTDVSKAYLRHALRGRFSDKVVKVLNAMMMEDALYFQAKLVQLLHSGHSSGIDTAFGIANSIMALRRYEHVRTSCDRIGRQRHFAASSRSDL